MVQSIIEGIRNYLAGCPALISFPLKRRHVDWTDPDNENYGIFKDSDEPAGAPYISGTREWRFTAQINIRQLTDGDIKRLEGNAFTERITEWLSEKEKRGELPEVPEGCEATDISVTNSGSYYTDDAGKKSAYFVQVTLNYIRYGGR